MSVSPVDNNADGSCKLNFNEQSLPHQKFECSVSKVREPIQADLPISYDEKPKADLCKNDTCAESNDGEATGCSRDGACGIRPCDESRPAKEPTCGADGSSVDLKNGRCRRPTFDDEQPKGAGSSRRNSEPWTGRESLQVSTPKVLLAKNPTADQKSAPPPTSNNRTLTNRTVINRSNGILQEFEKELCRVEQRRAQLMRCIERKQRALLIENREVRTSLQNYCEQLSSGGEKQSLHDTRDRRPPQHDTSKRQPSHYDTSKRQPPQYDTRDRQPSQHNTSERWPSQYDTRDRRPSQHNTSERWPSQYEIRERRSSHHDTRKRRPSQDDTRKPRPSQDDTRKRRSSQHDTRKRRPSQDDTRKRRPSQDNTRKPRPSQDTRKRRSSQHDTRKRRPSQDDTRERRTSQHYETRECRPSQHDTRERRPSQDNTRERQPPMLGPRERQSSKGESKNRKQPQGSFVVECFCNFIGADKNLNIEPATKQVRRDESYQSSARGVNDGNSCCPIQASSRHNNNNANNTTEVEAARKDAATTGRHGGSGRRSTPRNDATATSRGSAEQHRSHQDTFRPRGCSSLRVVDLISSTNNCSFTTVGKDTQKHNNRRCNETRNNA